MRQRLVMFHPAIAPYRVDFFNSLDEEFEATFYFEFRNALEQPFDKGILGERLTFEPRYLRPGFLGVKNLRLEVWGILRRERPDIVLISEYNLIGLIVLLYKSLFRRGLRIVITCDDNLSMAMSAGRIKRLTRSLLSRGARAVLLVNEEVRAWYETRLPYQARYLYFPIIQSEDGFRRRLAEALPRTAALREKYGMRDKKVILYVGRLAAVKNLPLLLRFFGRIHARRPDTALLLVGDGEARAELREGIQASGLDASVVMAGKQEGPELMAHYNLGDLFVLPSRYEPFGTVVNEALLAGCLVLCSSIAGASGLIKDGENGYRFDIGDEDAMLDKGIRLLEKADGRKPNRMLFAYREKWDAVSREIKK